MRKIFETIFTIVFILFFVWGTYDAGVDLYREQTILNYAELVLWALLWCFMLFSRVGDD